LENDQFEINQIVYPKEKASDPNYLDTPVYRFMGFEALQELLLSNSITLIKTKYWEDTYENFLFKSTITAGDTPFNLTSHQQWIYGSCWTGKSESDALWRIYSQNKCGVRIRSTIGKLAQCLQEQFDRSTAWIVNIGEVNYCTIQEIINYFEAFSEDDFVAEATKLFRESMFLKRREFEHEKEIRIILKVKSKQSFYNEVVSLPIVPKDVIEEITFDPRISNELQELFISKLKLIGYEKITNKSHLYNQERLRIRFKYSDDMFDIIK
jgi:hypothetical protein